MTSHNIHFRTLTPASAAVIPVARAFLGNQVKRVINVALGLINVIAKSPTFGQVEPFVNLEEANVARIMQSAQRLTVLIKLTVGTLAKRNFGRQRRVDPLGQGFGRD